MPKITMGNHKWYYYIKDIIIYVLFITVMYYCIRDYLNGAQTAVNFDLYKNLFTQVFLLILAFFGTLEMLYINDITLVIPYSYINIKQRKQSEIANLYVNEYIKNDSSYVRQYDQERMNYFISQLGISINRIDDIKLDIIRLRSMPLNTYDDIIRKLKNMITRDYVLIDQRKFNPSDITYNKVNYFINLIDLMFEKTYYNEIVRMMTLFFEEKLKKDLFNIDKIVIPFNSNFLLGSGVSSQLGKPCVKILSGEGRIIREQCWDGVLHCNDKVAIVHDVLVTGEQIIKSVEKIYQTCEIIGLFCLVARKEWKGKEVLSEQGIKTYSMIDLDDKDIEKIIGECKYC